MTTTGAGVVVLICDGHRHEGQDLAELCTLVAQLLPGVSVRSVHDLCRRPRALTRARRELSGSLVVVSPCRAHLHLSVSVRELRDAAHDRRIANERVVIIDPTGLSAPDAIQRVRLHAIALVAAANADEPLEPVLAPVEPTAGIDRRSLLTVRLHPRNAMPLSDKSCGASPMCRLCVDACPSTALAMRDGVPQVDTDACDGCAACVTACPTGILRIDSLPREAWETYLAALFDATSRLDLPLGICWSCRHASGGVLSETCGAWIRLRLPSLASLTPGWVLQPLAFGVSAVTVAPCESCTAFRVVDENLSRQVHEPAGIRAGNAVPADLLWWAAALGENGSGRHLNRDRGPRVSLREPTATADALLRLGSAGAVSGAPLVLPLGIIECDANRCTACGLCAEWCPSGALTIDDEHDSRILTFTHRACTACGACVAACPEEALQLRHGVDPPALRGQQQLIATDTRSCSVCGAAMPSPALAARLVAAGVRTPDDGVCGDCRVAGHGGPHPVPLSIANYLGD